MKRYALLLVAFVALGCGDKRSEGASDAGAVDSSNVDDQGTQPDASPSDLGLDTTASPGDAGPADTRSTTDFGVDTEPDLIADADTDDMSIILPTDPFPSPLVSAAALQDPGFGTIEFEARDGNVLTAYVYRATTFAADRGPILFVMHGAGRTAASYLQAAAPIAERRSALAVAIEFDAARYSSSESFTLGVGVTDAPYGPTYDPADWRPVSDYTYAEVEHLFEAIRSEIAGAQPGYLIVGHSAGAQFTHRLITFVPQNRALAAVAANAGWYTLPRADAGDPNTAMPYGLVGSPVEQDRARIVSAPLSVLVGSRDTEVDGNLRTTDEANAQGLNRFTRGQYYFATGEQEAASAGVAVGWRLGVAPLAGHDKDEMLPSADFYLFEPGEPCTPSVAADAGGLVFNEIHADPDMVDGDANNDGTVDSADDEFIEFVNDSNTPLCLTGWTLGDLANPERHVFPVNSTIGAGEALVVFGGGVPVGEFGESRVQWAAFGSQLSLTNSGDVLTLRDPSGVVVRQISWGDCGTQDCATDHITGTLSLNASAVRTPDVSGAWGAHDDVNPTRYSPGSRSDGTAFGSP